MAFFWAAAVGLALGVLTGAGIGGGTLLVLYLTTLGGMEQGAAQGINLLYFLVSAPAALFFHLKQKRVAVRPAVPAILLGCLLAAGGALLSQWVDQTWLRRGFGVLYLAVGIRELFFSGKAEKQGKAQ